MCRGKMYIDVTMNIKQYTSTFANNLVYLFTNLSFLSSAEPSELHRPPPLLPRQRVPDQPLTGI